MSFREYGAAATIPSPLGEFFAEATPLGIRRLQLARIGEGIRARHTPSRDAKYFLELLEAEMQSYFSGSLTEFSVPIDLTDHSSSFSTMVWAATQEILYGSRTTYACIARAVGRPRAARAVGQALARNPVLILVPCHRVVRSDGGTGGFAAGDHVKDLLLAHESNASLRATFWNHPQDITGKAKLLPCRSDSASVTSPWCIGAQP